MSTIMIAIQCPVCHYYFDAVTETLAKCERCGAVLDIEEVKHSEWYADRKKERARLTGIGYDVLPAGPWERGGGSKVKNKKKKPPRKVLELGPYDT